MTYSTKLGADINGFWSVNAVARYTDATLHFTGDFGFPSHPDAAQSTGIEHQLFGRGEAVWSWFDGRIRNYFSVDYGNDRRDDIAASNPVPSVTVGQRVKYDWRGVTELAPGNNLILGLEQETDQLQIPGLTAQSANKAGYVELQAAFARRMFLVANIRDDVSDQFGEHATFRIAPAVILPETETKLTASFGTRLQGTDAEPAVPELSGFQFFRQSEPEAGAERGLRPGFRAAAVQRPCPVRINLFPQRHHQSHHHQLQWRRHQLPQCRPGHHRRYREFLLRRCHRPDSDFARIIPSPARSMTARCRQLQRRPGRKWSTTATWRPIDPLTLSATVLTISSFTDVDRNGRNSGLIAPGYTIVNLAGDYLVNDQIRIFGRVDNLFNLHYQNPTGFLQPGFGIFGGVRLASFGVK